MVNGEILEAWKTKCGRVKGEVVSEALYLVDKAVVVTAALAVWVELDVQVDR